MTCSIQVSRDNILDEEERALLGAVRNLADNIGVDPAIVAGELRDLLDRQDRFQAVQQAYDARATRRR